jgi:hypothetical protein
MFFGLQDRIASGEQERRLKKLWTSSYRKARMLGKIF